MYLLIKSKRIKYKETGLDSFFIVGFFLHMVGAVLYAMVIQYYYGYGDSLGFFRGSNFLTSLTKDELTFKYFFYGPEQLSNLFLSSETGDNVIGAVINNDSNLMIIKISAALSLITFNKYLIITLFFGLFSFIGMWKLFLTFNQVLQGKSQRILAFTVLYTPSLWFWGSGLIKDSICLGCLGIITNIFYRLFIQKKFKITEVISFIVCFYLLFVVKSYIAATLLVGFVVFLIHFFIKSRNSRVEKAAYIIVIAIGAVLIFNFLIASYLQSIIEDSQVAIDSFKNTYENLDASGDAGSGFINKSFDFTPMGILLRSPGAIFTTLFRPFLWEIRNLMMLFSCLESVIALSAVLFLLIKLKVFRFFAYIISDPFILFAFIFVMILSALIGFTTFNFGTMVRYRIPVLPFYSFLLISIYVKYRGQKQLALNN
jgi:hypothetical protein